jgi:hypothetical protein
MYWLLIKHQKVYKVPLKKEDIFSKCLEWIKNADDLLHHKIESENQVTGIIKGKIFLKIQITDHQIPVEFNIRIECADSVYRTIFDEFYLYYLDTNFLPTQKRNLENQSQWDVIKPHLEKVDNNIYEYIILR